MQGNERSSINVYELGFLVAPIIEESALAEYVSKLRQIVEENECKTISEESPRLIPLAYEMDQVANSKKQTFNKAHFGSMKFEAENSCLSNIRAAIKDIDGLLRYTLIKTAREDTIFRPKFSKMRREEKVPVAAHGDLKVAEVSEEEIDKSIEALIEN